MTEIGLNAGSTLEPPLDRALVQAIHSKGRQHSRARTAPSLKISIFDLDRTITRRPTYSAFLLRAAWRMNRRRLLLLPLLLPSAIAYAAGRLPRKVMKERMQRLALGRDACHGDVIREAERFAREVAERGIYAQARAAIRSDLSEGRRVMIATAAPSYYAAAIGRALGIREVIATHVECQGDRLLARIDGENCHGPHKQAMIARHLEQRGLTRNQTHLRFYSDDSSDLPTFHWCDEPIAVNPSPKLAAQAQAQGWRMIDWRHEGGIG